MLKKFTEFSNENTNTKPVSKPDEKKSGTKVPTPIVKEPKEPKPDTMKSPDVKDPKMENFVFNGKVVQFPKEVKPSISLVMLENNNICKEKLHYIISKQTDDTLVVLKYNENVEMKLNEFVTKLIEYYKTNEQLTTTFDKIVVEGSSQFAIIKNIPDVKVGDNKLIQVLNQDLIKLLK